MIMLQNRNMRAIDRLFDRMTGFSGMTSPLAAVDNWFDNLERDARIASAPENGIVTRYELVAKNYQREVNEQGDVIYRLLTDDEMKVLQSNKEVDAESA